MEKYGSAMKFAIYYFVVLQFSFFLFTRVCFECAVNVMALIDKQTFICFIIFKTREDIVLKYMFCIGVLSFKK